VSEEPEIYIKRVAKSGNSKTVTIPDKVLNKIGAEIGDYVKITIVNNKIVVEKIDLDKPIEL